MIILPLLFLGTSNLSVSLLSCSFLSDVLEYLYPLLNISRYLYPLVSLCLIYLSLAFSKLPFCIISIPYIYSQIPLRYVYWISAVLKPGHLFDIRSFNITLSHLCITDDLNFIHFPRCTPNVTVCKGISKIIKSNNDRRSLWKIFFVVFTFNFFRYFILAMYYIFSLIFQYNLRHFQSVPTQDCPKPRYRGPCHKLW